ncbi:MAG: AAA family ATPase [Woeseiaceae bacterium]|nr:AAA family ATPase [Gammaproteobacteria bacterium]NNK26292.1 AAA family ATPase [Woeseiaceae bacterium]
MARSLEQTVFYPTYLEFFGLTRPPFARIAEPSQFFQTEQYSLLMGHLGNATKRADCLVALCGARGAGKSTLLNQYISNLGHQSTFVAVDGSCDGEEGFYCEFLTQIGFTDISGTAGELRNITSEFLKYRGDAGDPVVVIVDNAHKTDPIVLQQIRHIAGITTNGGRVVSVVLAGDADLVRVLDSPAMSHTRFDSHVVFNIRAYTEDETANYVWHHLRCAGGNDGVNFAREAHRLIHRYSGGTPELINRLCNDLLAEAFRLESRVITDKIVRAVANKQRLLPYVVPMHGRGRRRTDPDFEDAALLPDTEERIETGSSTPKKLPDQSDAQTADADPGHLQQRIAALAEQVKDLQADKLRVLQEVAERNEEIGELRNELDAKTAEVESLNEQNRKLQETVDGLETQLKAADARAVDIASLERNAALLQYEVGGKAGELDAVQLELGSASEELESVTAELESARSELEWTQAELQSRNQAFDKLTRQIADIEQRSGELEVELGEKAQAKSEQAVEIEALGKKIIELEDALEQKSLDMDSIRKELDSRNESLVALKVRLDRSQSSANLAQLRMLELKSPQELAEIEAASARLAADLETETAARKAAEEEVGKLTAALDELRQLKRDMPATVSVVQADLESEPDDVAAVSADDARRHSSVVVQGFEELIRNNRAYRTLRKYDPAFYFSLIATYKRLIGLGHTDKQVNDALRAEQAELIEKLLPKASGNAIIAYAQLVVAQLDKFKLDGTEPCFTLLIPQTHRGIHALPVFSESTREFELAVLDTTLKTYNDELQVPSEEDVWTDLEPVFLKLFKAYGQDNVSAVTSSDDPGTDRAIDRELLCDINLSLYSGILKLPKPSAVNAFRWILSP